MSYMFKFEHDGKCYEVAGKYGSAVNEGFSVVTLVDGAKRMLRAASSDVPSGKKLENFITAESEGELIQKLQASYPRMKDFSPY